MRVITNCREMARLLDRQCQHEHDHQRVEGKVRIGGVWCNRSLCAQVYPKDLVETFVKGIRDTKRHEEHDVLAVESLADDAKNLKERVFRCHTNLVTRFIHMLRKSAGASEKAIQLGQELKFGVCMSRKKPNTHPVTKAKRAEGFNQQVCLDTFDVPIYNGKTIKMLNMICEGLVPLWKGAKAKDFRRAYAYRKYWIRWGGVPVRVLTDGGPEFEGEMQEGLDRDGSYVFKIASESPWQNGLVERHGGLWKEVFLKGFEECQPRNKEEVNDLCDRTNQAKNSMTRKSVVFPISACVW